MSKERNPRGFSLRRILPGLLLAGLVLLAQRMGWLDRVTSGAGGATTTTESPAGTVQELFRTETSGVMITLDGVVHRMLPDDDDGSRHQRFLIRVDGDQTLLVAHNIDLAPRVPLDQGDRVRIHGQYEWNEQGGVLHWTHHDPGGRHEEGWIEHEGKRYE